MDTTTAQPAPEFNPDELLTPGEVARAFRVDAKTVTRWETAGKLPAIRTLGGHRRFRRTDVESALAAAGS